MESTGIHWNKSSTLVSDQLSEAQQWVTRDCDRIDLSKKLFANKRIEFSDLSQRLSKQIKRWI